MPGDPKQGNRIGHISLVKGKKRENGAQFVLTMSCIRSVHHPLSGPNRSTQPGATFGRPDARTLSLVSFRIFLKRLRVLI